MRFDDINHRMDWQRFLKIKNILEKYNIKSILGVVPDCKDYNLMVANDFPNYFEYLRKYKSYGDAIAQHGYQHIYDSKVKGIFANSFNSEFAGHKFEKQLRKISKGKTILREELLWDPIFMAPAHSFDKETLKALRELDFNIVLDGYSLYPYIENNLIFIPQISSNPLPIFLPGISQLCIHINTISDKELERLIKFINKNHSRFISIYDISFNKKYINIIDKNITFLLINVYRFLKSFSTIYKKLFINFRCITQRIYYKILFKNKSIYDWHLSGTFYCRKYKMTSLKIINSLKPDIYIDIGCGLGEILSKVTLESKFKYGYDSDGRLKDLITSLYIDKFIFFQKEDELFEHASLKKKDDDLVVISMLGFAHNLSRYEIEQLFINYHKKIGSYILLIDAFYVKDKLYKYNHHEFLYNHNGLIKFLFKVDNLRSLYCIQIGK